MLVTRFTAMAAALLMVAPVVAQDNDTPVNPEAPAQRDAAVEQRTEVERDRQQTQQRPQFIPSTELIGANLYGQNQDESIGTINDIVLGTDGKVLYLVAGSGGVAGVGQTEHAIPVSAVNVDWRQADNEHELHVSIPLSEDDLSNAPELSLEHARDLTAATFHERNSKYFKATNAPRVQGNDYVLVSEITDLDVMGRNNESVATLEGLLLSKQGDWKAEYYLLGTGGALGVGEDYTAAPFKSVKVQTRDNEFVASIDADERTLGAAPKISSDNHYAGLNDRQTQEAIKNAFGGQTTQQSPQPERQPQQ